MAEARRRELDIRRDVAEELGRTAVEIARNGFYFNAAGERVDIGELVAKAVSAKQSLPPDILLPTSQRRSFPETRIQVANETTLGASRRLVEKRAPAAGAELRQRRSSGRRLSPRSEGAGRGALPVEHEA